MITDDHWTKKKYLSHRGIRIRVFQTKLQSLNHYLVNLKVKSQPQNPIQHPV